MDGVDELALLLLKPDAVHQGLLPGITSFLRARDFQVVVAATRRISHEERYQIYQPDSRPWATNWPLGGILYTLGPAVMMLLRCDHVPAGYASASHFLARGLKGHYDPIQAGSGTIRGEFNAVNPALNLVHASDDSPDVVRELAILFDGRDVHELLAAPTGDAALADIITGRPRPLDFGATMLALHESLLDRDGHGRAFRAAATELVAGCRTRLRAATGRHARRDILASALDLIRALGVCCGSDAGRLSRRLSDRGGLATLDFDAAFDQLARAGLALDLWTRYLVQTSLYYLDAPPLP
jgi:nucleoside diphosphate kinase